MLYEGYTANYLKVLFPATDDMIGEIVKVKITKAGYPINEGQFVTVVKDISKSASSEWVSISCK